MLVVILSYFAYFSHFIILHVGLLLKIHVTGTHTCLLPILLTLGSSILRFTTLIQVTKKQSQKQMEHDLSFHASFYVKATTTQ